MELTLLPDGIYERVISDELGKVLDEASKEEQIWKETETVDSQEGARYLSDYAGRLIHCCLKEIADQDEEGSTALSKELHLVNDLIRLLSKRMETLGEGHTVSREDFLLTQLKRRQNTLKEIILERPLSGLSHSTLFTNSKKDVSLVTELQREIQSADRIDLLVSFIKYSGYIMIRPYLQEFTRHGGKLRVLTTTYMGATDPKAGGSSQYGGPDFLQCQGNASSCQGLYFLPQQRLFLGLCRIIKSLPCSHRRWT